jgi:hypothetical protein
VQELVRQRRQQQTKILVNRNAKIYQNPTNFVEKNRRQTEDWQERLFVQRQMQAANSRQADAAQKRVDISNELAKYRLFKNIKWNVIKERRAQIEREIAERQENRRSCTALIKHIYLMSMLKIIVAKVKKCRELNGKLIERVASQMVVAKAYHRLFNRRCNNID